MNEEETEVFLTAAVGMGQFKTQMHEEVLELLNLWVPNAVYYDSERV